MAKKARQLEFGEALSGLLSGISAHKAGRPVPKAVKKMTFGPGAAAQLGLPKYKGNSYPAGTVRAVTTAKQSFDKPKGPATTGSTVSPAATTPPTRSLFSIMPTKPKKKKRYV